MIITLVYRVVKTRVTREKASKTFVCEDMSEDSSGSDIDYDEDGNAAHSAPVDPNGDWSY